MAQNKNSGTIAVAVVSLLLVGTAIYFIAKALKKPTPKPNVDAKTKDSGTTTTTTTTTNMNPSDIVRDEKLWGQFGFQGYKFPIRLSQKNDSVKELQKLLLGIDKSSIRDGATGYFGTQTQQALLKYLGKKSVDSQVDIDKLSDLLGQNIELKLGQGILIQKK